MYFRINLLACALAMTVASGAMAYDYGTKGTAMQNIENRPSPSPQVVSAGPIEKHYDKGTVASINRDADARRAESSRMNYESASTRPKGRSSAYKPTYYATHDE